MTDVAPPVAFGLVWSAGSDAAWGTGLVFHAEPTAAFRAAYREARDGLRAVGFAFTSSPPYQVTFSANRATPASVDRAIQIATEAVATTQSDLANRSRSELRKLIDGPLSWALDASVRDEASVLAGKTHLTATETARAARLTIHAMLVVTRAWARALGTVASPDDMVRARSPDVRLAALQAVRRITSSDADKASCRNGIGWSQSTSPVGHVLAGMASFEEAACATALTILRRHRNQVDPVLHPVLFGDV